MTFASGDLVLLRSTERLFLCLDLRVSCLIKWLWINVLAFVFVLLCGTNIIIFAEVTKNILPISCRGETKSGFLRYIMWGVRGDFCPVFQFLDFQSCARWRVKEQHRRIYREYLGNTCGKPAGWLLGGCWVLAGWLDVRRKGRQVIATKPIKTKNKHIQLNSATTRFHNMKKFFYVIIICCIVVACNTKPTVGNNDSIEFLTDFIEGPFDFHTYVDGNGDTHRHYFRRLFNEEGTLSLWYWEDDKGNRWASVYWAVDENVTFHELDFAAMDTIHNVKFR